ncbi:MAG: hypothetical protein QXV17_05025 [Candidatus Micrarchaeaceae archaeon]
MLTYNPYSFKNIAIKDIITQIISAADGSLTINSNNISNSYLDKPLIIPNGTNTMD